jgi:DNA-binding GntR family transcriptional regulator
MILIMTDVDHESSIPVYRQVAAILRERIEAGTYQPGRRLPSVRDLVQEFGIAQLTARKALRVLVDDGVAEMSPGMGTFVKAP